VDGPGFETLDAAGYVEEGVGTDVGEV